MTYSLNPDAPVFSYTREELFQCIKNIIEQDKSSESRALAVLLVFEDYFSNFTESDNNGSHYVYERDELDFEDFVRYKLNLEYYHPVNADEILK